MNEQTIACCLVTSRRATDLAKPEQKAAVDHRAATTDFPLTKSVSVTQRNQRRALRS
jgi:hypothetical protein